MSVLRLARSCQIQGNVTSILSKAFVGVFYLATLFPVSVLPANADEFSVFGPQAFDRAEGKPSKEDVIITAPEAGNHYLLRVNNSVEGKNSVSSGRVSLNGELIIGPKDLDRRSPNVERNIFLNTTNELVVEIKGNPDSGLVLEIVGIDGGGAGDDDGDGVPNDQDQCPGTSPGAQVDGNGCSASQLDNDNDGVSNDLDQCPGTPAGAAVNANGCAESQLDDDGDGVDNSIDQCPNTEPGAAVDANGCTIGQPDDDGDGVSNEFDLCPGTSPGESVDGDGCSASQLDDDNDGVTNDVDQCPGTPAGVAVDSFGCDIAGEQLPPDPASVANPLDPAAITGFKEAVEFLYTSDTPVQTDVIASSISDKGAAVIRGAVVERNGNSISGVTISIHKHPEFGKTLSRNDGLFDLAVNGGRRLIVNYEKPGYLPVQRSLEVPSRNFVTIDNVVMIPLDTQVSTIDLSDGSVDFQIARGSIQSDNDGSRQVTVLFPQGAEAVMTLADGSTRSLTTLNVRGTEYTVGGNGLEAMPGELPPRSGYTYAVELSVDEAIAAGATRVDFSQPLAMYVDNFLEFPVGMAVPLGWYDRESAAWIPSQNGQVIEIMDIKGGLAVLDVGGSGVEATSEELAAMGISDGERRQLATLYNSGKTLWRSNITHFTPWDCNWPYGLPEDAEPPQQPEPDTDETEEDPCEQSGSIIECQNAVLRERIPIAGTPFNLNYRSDLVPGRKAYADIQLSGSTISASLLYIDLRVSIAGQLHSYRFPAQSNLTHQFIWDGMDAYGRQVVGKQHAKISIGYVYPGIYYEPDERRKSFAVAGGAPISRNTTRTTITIWQTSSAQFQAASPAAAGLGSWLITPQHHYDPASETLMLGNGSVQNRQTDDGIIKTVAGSGESISSGDGDLATEAGLRSPYDVAFAPDGSFYILNSGHQHIRRVDTNGIISTISVSTHNLFQPESLVVGDDGSLYVADAGNNRVLRVARDGSASIYAGTGASGFSGDGGPATDATLRTPTGLAIDRDGSLFIVDRFNDRIRKVGVDGIISTVAGNGLRGFSGDGGPATSARLNLPYDVAVAPDGSVYISDTLNDRVRKVGFDGTITTVAGTVFGGFSGDGGPATSAKLSIPTGVAVDNNGDVYIADYNNQRIRRIGSDGRIHTIAGDGLLGFEGDNGPATSASLAYPRGITVTQGDSLYIADNGNYRVRRVGIQNVASGGDVSIPSATGDLLYHFNEEGHHLSTRNAITGGVLYTFHYDDNKRLISIEDGDGNVTRIERDFEGNPSAIVAPDGQWTSLSIDSNGYISTVTNPESEAYSVSYTEDGLLTRFTDPNGNSSSMSYDELGRLKSDTNAEGGGWTIERLRLPDGAEYRMTSAEDRLYRYQIARSSSGGRLRTNIRPDGTISTTSYTDSGEIISRWADGTEVVTKEGPDPRFGMTAPVPESVTTTTPSGLIRTVTTERTVQLVDTNDILSHTALDQTISINGRTQTSQYDAGTRTWVSTSAEGRGATTELDSQGRPLMRQQSGLAALNYRYDNRGRLIDLTIGSGSLSRLTQFDYDNQGNLASTTDPLLRTSYFDYDLAGRITRQTFPDGRVVDYEYDDVGNLAAIIPPGREAHIFSYNRVNQEDTYTPPGLTGVQTITRYEYNLDKQLTRIIRPDGRNVNYSYDTGGRLSQLAIARGQYTYSYHNATGQLTQITAPDGGLLSYTYDGFLPMSETWSGTIAGSVSRSYDNNFWLTERCVNSRSCVSFSYDDDGLLNAAGALNVTRHSQHGLITDTAIGGVSTSSSYNSFGETLDYQALVSGSSVVDINYQRNALGRITAKTDIVAGNTINASYEYDSAGRLVAVTRNGETTIWQYDSNGNRTHENGASVATYDDQDRLLAYKDVAYTYTDSGALDTKTQSGSITHYQYDELGNLIAVALPGDVNISYVIDGQSRRVGKKVNGKLVQGFLYTDQINPVAELDELGNIAARFVYLGKLNVPEYMIKDGVIYRIISDHLGSPRLVLNASTGEIAQRMEYDAWGNVVADSNPGFQPFGFAGGIYDQHTGLVRFGARDYDSKIGRWTTKDPIRFDGGGPNLYVYLGNSPLEEIDPFGLATKRCARGLGGPNKPPMSPSGNPVRHDYLVVGNDVYSFQSGDSKIWSQGYIDDNEKTSNSKCEKISDDPKFDQAVRDAVNEIGAPPYNVAAYPGTTPWAFGARNCQTWANDVLDRAKDKYSP